MQTQYQQLIKFIEDTKCHFYSFETVESPDQIVNAMLRGSNLIAVQVDCGWHGDSHKKSEVFLITKNEYPLIEALVSKMNKY